MVANTHPRTPDGTTARTTVRTTARFQVATSTVAAVAAVALTAVTLIGIVQLQSPRSTSVVSSGETDPALARLDPALLAAFRRAAEDAAADGVELRVNSGWRSVEEQERLLREAVRRYGSREEAARWVATPAASSHVTGDAIDVGGPGATDWLAVHGSSYGLCRIYDNEPWHYELRRAAITDGCPDRYADAAARSDG
ncbi:peptidase M15 [Nocardioides albidus]|uniref:Peptidase M15 n=1 Tax=Nocardioides albidus TaxID=1517589 RepID=A0A5C4VQB3_9ACTN|nr:M15 family metallopeptidase [Nocardioides albidus]TNM37469.1 peptidase M15 [Nocardioides albidus]